MTTDITGLIERLEAIDEESMYQEPASTKAVIDAAAAALKVQQAQISQLHNDVALHRGRWQRLVNAWADAFTGGMVYGDDTEAVKGTIEQMKAFGSEAYR